MDNTLMQLGVAGILILLFIKEMFGFLKYFFGKKGIKSDGAIHDALVMHIEESKSMAKDMKTMKDQVHWLKEAHDIKDDDGRYIWYIKNSLEESIKLLAINIADQTKVMNALVNKLNGEPK